MTNNDSNLNIDIRNEFLNFFKNNDHQIVPSASLIPSLDPTLLFTGAGMVPFKNYILGIDKPPAHNLCSSQLCLRAGGKHNDLENVGYTARHHTLFEMLGNFSFDGYYKEQAIKLAFDFICNNLQIDKEKLLVTVYHTDDEAFSFWKKISGLHEKKIIRIKTSDNFWSMGDTGPCGPCSEIFYDYGENVKGGPPGSKDEDGDRFVEIWNLVFMQFDKDKDGNLNPLQKKCIDTGMGLERISSVISGKQNNFDTNLFVPIIKKIASISQKQYEGEDKISMRVIADHLRAICFLIIYGVRPGNEGRNYVLRRILRRAMRYAKNLSNETHFLSDLVDVFVDDMGKVFIDLENNRSMIKTIIKREEEKFSYTLENGIKLLDEEIKNLSKNKFDGKTAFKLYDTFGFPIDLTADYLRRKNIDIDMIAFEKELEKQKQKSKAKETKNNFIEDFISHNSTDIPHTQFFYDKSKIDGCKVIELFDEKEKLASLTSKGYMLVDKTTFYARSGGQAGDSGVAFNENCQIEIIDTVKIFNKYHLLEIKIKKGKLSIGDLLTMEIDKERRAKIVKNHSATHMLQAALRKEIGKEIVQKGSQVDEHKLRFDFTHDGPLSEEMLRKIELRVNKNILRNKETLVEEMPINEAIEKGALAIFGEKYETNVRVVTIGEENNEFFSKELCGGTHIKNSSEIGLFVITNETSISAGVRRIEAITGINAFNHMMKLRDDINQISKKLKTPDILKKIDDIIENKKENNKQKIEKIEFQKKSMNGNEITYAILRDTDVKLLRAEIDKVKNSNDEAIVFLFNISENKISALCGLGKNKLSDFDAATLLNKILGKFNGKGGGRKDFAQGGGEIDPNEKNIDEFIVTLLGSVL